MYLDSTDIEQLKMKSAIGPRIRIIRECLRKKFGNHYSGNSVSSRIEGLTQSTLTMIEREKIKSISAEVLYYIAKDFGVFYDVFFNDFYLQPDPQIMVTPPLIEKNAENNKEIISRNQQNPLNENEFILNIKVSKIASNGDYQMILDRKSKQLHEQSRIITLVAQIIHNLNIQDVLANNELLDNTYNNNPIKIAKELVENSINNILVFPWYDGSFIIQYENKAFDEAIKYTEELLQLKQKKEEEKSE